MAVDAAIRFYLLLFVCEVEIIRSVFFFPLSQTQSHARTHKQCPVSVNAHKNNANYYLACALTRSLAHALILYCFRFWPMNSENGIPCTLSPTTNTNRENILNPGHKPQSIHMKMYYLLIWYDECLFGISCSLVHSMTVFYSLILSRSFSPSSTKYTLKVFVTIKLLLDFIGFYLLSLAIAIVCLIQFAIVFDLSFILFFGRDIFRRCLSKLSMDLMNFDVATIQISKEKKTEKKKTNNVNINKSSAR